MLRFLTAAAAATGADADADADTDEDAASLESELPTSVVLTLLMVQLPLLNVGTTSRAVADVSSCLTRCKLLVLVDTSLRMPRLALSSRPASKVCACLSEKPPPASEPLALLVVVATIDNDDDDVAGRRNRETNDAATPELLEFDVTLLMLTLR